MRDTMLGVSGRWCLVPGTGQARFAVSKLGGRRVHGTVPVTALEAHVDGGQPTRVRAVLDATSVDTRHPKRDRSLRGRRWLAVEHHPAIQFDAATVEPAGGAWVLHGVLVVRGVGSSVAVIVDSLAIGNTSARVSGRARVDRLTTGVRHGPRWMVGQWVDVEVEAELIPSATTGDARTGEP